MYKSHLVLPSALKKIGSSTFFGCPSLSSITIPVGVEAIEGYAFDGCTSLTHIVLPSSLKKIGSSTFFGCPSLSSITIPDGVEAIEGYAFDGCTSLTAIVLPSSLKKIGMQAFNGCPSLSSIYQKGVANLAGYAFIEPGMTTFRSI